MTKRAIIIAADGIQDVELIYPYYRLQEAGYEVRIAAPGGRPFHGIKGVPFVPAIGFNSLPNPAEAEGLLILPGGVKAMEKLRLERSAVEYVRAHHEHGGVIGCICSGAQLLISAGLCRGLQMSAYYAMKVDVENAGGVFIDAECVRDRRIVSSPHYNFLGAWMHGVLVEAGQ